MRSVDLFHHNVPPASSRCSECTHLTEFGLLFGRNAQPCVVEAALNSNIYVGFLVAYCAVLGVACLQLYRAITSDRKAKMAKGMHVLVVLRAALHTLNALLLAFNLVDRVNLVLAAVLVRRLCLQRLC